MKALCFREERAISRDNVESPRDVSLTLFTRTTFSSDLLQIPSTSPLKISLSLSLSTDIIVNLRPTSRVLRSVVGRLRVSRSLDIFEKSSRNNPIEISRACPATVHIRVAAATRELRYTRSARVSARVGGRMSAARSLRALHAPPASLLASPSSLCFFPEPFQRLPGSKG